MATTTASSGSQPSDSQKSPNTSPSVFSIAVDLITSPIVATFSYIGEIGILCYQTVKSLMRNGVDIPNLIDQMGAIGLGSLPIAMLTVFSSAAVITLYFATFLISYGAGNLTGAAVALSMGRELAPVLVGVVVAARAGSAIAAEIGTMKVSEQIDALRSLAVSPIQYLVVPRLLAALIMVPLICIVADAVGMYSGYLVAVWQNVPPASYASSISQYTELRDFTLGIVKTIVFAFIIALVGCHQGLRTKGGATGVGKSTTNSVVLSIVLIYISDFFLAYFMFGGATGK